MEEKKLVKYENVRQLAMSMAVYSSTSILGPLLLISGIGYFLDKKFDTSPVILLISILIAFFVTNVLLFRKIKDLMKTMDEKLKNDKQKIEKNNL